VKSKPTNKRRTDREIYQRRAVGFHCPAGVRSRRFDALRRRLEELEREVRADSANWNTGSPVSDPDCELAHRVWPILSLGWRQRWWDETDYGGRPGASAELVAVLHQRADVLKLLQRKLPDDEWAGLEEYLQTVINKRETAHV
jgi:hypothetical protein